ncbi:hypothetical protein [Snodgrassella alvi]|uniref:hypothetical protein n=1 Tax=Snodgrassella alvi TaxID=1196083 RepID=UPI001183043E|nr:hypothetical protein [Snodgrassella alvi]
MTKKIKPMEEIPNEGTVYFTVQPIFKDDSEALEVFKYTFDADGFDYRVLDRGIAFEEEKHAKCAANIILNLMRKTEPLPGCITSQPDESAEVWVIAFTMTQYCFSIGFSQSHEQHQKALKNHMLFSSEKDASAAAKFILAALKAEVLRQNFNCLTEAPADGTIVFALSTFTPCGYIQQPFNCNESRCMRLLESGLLFTSEEDVVRAYEHLIQQINPTKPKAVPEVPAEPDAQPDMPF